MIDFLVVGAHPDDESVVTGLLLKAKKEGKKTGLICFTKGEAGGFATKEDRVRELKNAAELLELDYFKHLDHPDAGVEYGIEAVEELVPLLREASPQVVLTIHPDDYHPDHVAVSKTVDRAVFVAGLKKHSSDDKTWHPKQVLYFSLDPRTNSQRPDMIIDISDVYEKKLEVVGCHQSQGIAQFVELSAKQMGMLGGFEYGEGLYIRQPFRLSDINALLSQNKIGR
ncbi:PIG-L family deacetylase [Vallitalea okinawensis]|uniref:PIG-L family deacetylase n=1 Tax=Vallitalea okinawensis TaxID=2078660 RepID=UPI000CFC1520|nr:PIG-L family deacetylase [Vallitalea okinawensis]